MSTPHVLVIDDDRGSLEVLALLLEMAGLHCTTLQDPRHLEATLAALPRLDLVFLDLEMPNVDGYQIFNFLRDQQQFAAVPIIAHTVHLSEINTVKNVGFHSFLAKPLDADVFPKQLSALLRGEQIWQGF